MTEQEEKNIKNAVLKLILVLLLAVALCAAAYYIYKAIRKRKKKQEPREAEAARQAAFRQQRQGEFVCLTYAAMCEEVARLGFARAPADTPAEYLRTISQRVPSVESEAGTITGALTDLLYAGRVPESSVLAKLDALLAQVRGKVGARLAAEEQAAR
jgi:type II secretory pathway pseudopilin PulG